jgi:hypothetical protein
MKKGAILVVLVCGILGFFVSSLFAQAITLSHDTVDVFTSVKPVTLIIFVNNACQSCLNELAKWTVDAKIDTAKCRVICLVGTAPNGYARRKSIQSLRPLFESAEIVFDKQADVTLMRSDAAYVLAKQFNITATPSVLIWKNSRLALLLKYETLFDPTGILSPNSIRIMLPLLKSK